MLNHNETQQTAPDVTLTLQIASLLKPMLNIDDPMHNDLYVAIEQGLAGIMGLLGIPGRAIIEISVLDERLAGDEILILSVNGRRIRYPNDLAAWIYAYVIGDHAVEGEQPAAILARLGKQLGSPADKIAHQELVEFLTLICLEIVKLRPAMLLGQAQAEVYSAALPAPEKQRSKILKKHERPSTPTSWPPEPTQLLPILHAALTQKCSIADRHIVANVLGNAGNRSVDEISEELIAALCSDTIEIQLSSDYLRQIIDADPGNQLGMFPNMRKIIFDDLGVIYPPFRFVPVDYLKPHSFAFRIGALATRPMLGLRPDQCFVSRIPLLLNVFHIAGVAAINPMTGEQVSLIHSADRSRAQELSLSTLDFYQYLILSFMAALRRDAACFVHRKSVEQLLSQMDSIFPALAKATRDNMPIPVIVRILRALVAEGISVRNMRLILERALDYELGLVDASQSISLDDTRLAGGAASLTPHQHLDHLLAFVRSGLARQLRHKYIQDGDTLPVYLLDPAIEHMLLEKALSEVDEYGSIVLDEQARDQILGLLREELDSLPTMAQIPALLTTANIRPTLHEVVAAEFPHVPVLSYNDVPLNTQFRTIANRGSSA